MIAALSKEEVEILGYLIEMAGFFQIKILSIWFDFINQCGFAPLAYPNNDDTGGKHGQQLV